MYVQPSSNMYKSVLWIKPVPDWLPKDRVQPSRKRMCRGTLWQPTSEHLHFFLKTLFYLLKGNIFLDTEVTMWADICYITHKEVLAAEALGKDFKRTAQNLDGQMLSQGLLLIDIWMHIFVTVDSSQSCVHYSRIRLTSRKLFLLYINKRKLPAPKHISLVWNLSFPLCFLHHENIIVKKYLKH